MCIYLNGMKVKECTTLCSVFSCQYLGCDYEIDSDAIEDQCGVCHGNGSTCETVRKTFEDSEGHGL